MTSPDPKKREWLDPPDWWRKWRPLRWCCALLMLVAVFVWFRPLFIRPPEVTPPPPPVHAPVGASAPVALAAAPVADAALYEEGASRPRAYKDYLASPRDPITLMTELKSYSGIDEIHQQLRQQGFEPEQRSFHERVPPGVPPRELDLLRVASYVHLGVEGDLELQFFNDRLYQAEFEPDDVARYLTAVRRNWPGLKRQRAGRSELREGHLRVASSLDLALSEVGHALGTRPFVLWQDLRLVQQRDAWDREFAKKAAP